jgi:hypothetical protein
MEIDHFLSNYSEEVQTIVHELRDLLKKELPQINERLDSSAKMIAYGYGNTYKEHVCSVFPSKKGVKLGFNHGAQLNNSAGLLAGTGKISRYIEVKNADLLKSKELVDLIGQAQKLYLGRME